LFLRALFAFLALPGMVAVAIPAFIGRRELDAGGHFTAVGLLPLAAGFTLLLWCVHDFYVSGKGTLAPWSPPRNLVTVGLYRYTRNPMYVAVTMMLTGWAVSFWSPTLAIYTGIVMLAFHLRVIFGEEPWLARAHGDAWNEYKSKTPRWLL
jgi:protein-S-isoprenylcysteine O-methyltransferase Ste14